MYKLTLAIFFIVAVSYNSYGAQKMSGAAKSVASPRVNPEIGVEGIDNISLKLFLGSFDPKSNKGKLTGQSGGFSVGLGGSLYLERLRYLAIDWKSVV